MSFKSSIKYFGRITFLFCTLYPLAFVIVAFVFALQHMLLDVYPFSCEDLLRVPFTAILGAMHFSSPGSIVAAASAMLLTSSVSRRADVCLLVSALFAFVVFQQWYQIDVTMLKNDLTGDMLADFLSPILAALGFGLGTFILALILPEVLLYSSGESPHLVRQRRLASLRTALPILLLLVTFSAVYFYECSLHSY